MLKQSDRRVSHRPLCSYESVGETRCRKHFRLVVSGVLCSLFSFLVCKGVHGQELNTSAAIDSVIKKIRLKMVKKVKLGKGKKNSYGVDKNSDKNYWFFIHPIEGGATGCLYYNDQLVLIRQFSKNLPGEKVANNATFYIYKDEVIDKYVQGREVLPAPLIEFAKQYKEEAKKIILQNK